tara:strand:+ start:5862 stop:7013 length:1152 start_codon:yes stop_codon:yes gene_type:complete
MNEEENKVVEAVEETPQQVEAAEPAKENLDPDVIKIDLREINQSPPKEPVEAVAEEVVEKVVEEVVEEAAPEVTQVLEEVTEEEITAQAEQLTENIQEAIVDQKESGIELPENIQKVVDFMNDTGGSLEDYVKLNQDYGTLDEKQLLFEYYKQSKPHLANDEIDFLIEDKFDFDEDLEDERDIKRKKLAFKEELVNAKSHLNNQKSKYYEEIKAGSKLTQDQQKAVEFFNRFNTENEEATQVASQQKNAFLQQTDQVFSDKFKGFEYNVGDKKYRFNVKNTSEVKNTQSDINNFVKKFLDDKNTMKDARGYHKSLFTAMNADAVANHFYEQGKADALKESITKSKNVDMTPKGTHQGAIETSGWKARVVSGDDSSRLKVNIRK